MIRRPPRSTLDRSSAASDVYKRQLHGHRRVLSIQLAQFIAHALPHFQGWIHAEAIEAVSYTHLRAHETVLDLVCRLLLEKKKNILNDDDYQIKIATHSALTINLNCTRMTKT